ncbi:MAG: dihydroneopterin aldolase [Rickettsiales bacterium]
MNHYAQMLTVNRLRLEVHLGFYEAERLKKQPVEICLRLYFAQAPDASTDDHAHFIDYGAMCAALSDYVTSRDFRLVEFMAHDVFRHMRTWVDGQGGNAVKLWLKLNKCEAPVPNLQDGASYILSDLPAGATAVANWP